MDNETIGWQIPPTHETQCFQAFEVDSCYREMTTWDEESQREDTDCASYR